MNEPIPKFLYDLAPLHLPNSRVVRFKADGQFVPLGRFEARDRDLIRALYVRLDDLLGRLVSRETSDAQKLRDVLDWIERYRIERLVEEAQLLGAASLAEHSDVAIAKTVHDIRGGALTSLLGYLELLPEASDGEAQLGNLYRLCRDQMKILRSAITGLDDTRRAVDSLPRSHDVEVMIGKWQTVVIGPQVDHSGAPVRMFVDCRHEGAVTECCLESAAIDRIFYNLTSNARRHSATDHIDLVVFRVPDNEGPNLRFVLSNEVTPSHGETLRELAGRTREGDLRGLFKAGVTSTGSGYGMAVVADFVAGAFGLASSDLAVARGYTGACLDGSTFRAWFHWPVARDGLDAMKFLE